MASDLSSFRHRKPILPRIVPRPFAAAVPFDASGATVKPVKKPVSFTRRKLSTVVRRAITSYYTEHEQAEIARAAGEQNVSMSSFVASEALKEARRLNRR